MTDPGIAEQMEKLQRQFERFEEMTKRSDARLARLDGLQEELEGLEAAVTSPDRAVTVVAGPGGGVKSIRFGEEARKLSPTQLSQAANATLRQAVAQASRQQAEIIKSRVGADSNAFASVMRTQREFLGARLDEDTPAPQPDPPAAGASAAPRHARPGPRDEDEDEDGFGSVFDVEPNRPSRPSQPQRPNGREDEFLKLYDSEDGW